MATLRLHILLKFKSSITCSWIDSVNEIHNNETSYQKNDVNIRVKQENLSGESSHWKKIKCRKKFEHY